MSSDLQELQDVVDSVSRQLVGEMAPEELELFDTLAQEYRESPNPPTSTAKPNAPLGFGLSAEVIAVSPAVIAAVTSVLMYVLDVAKDSLKDQSKTFIAEQVRLLFQTKKAATAPLVLTPEQLTKVQSMAMSEARRFGLKKDEAQRLADALAGRLAMGT